MKSATTNNRDSFIFYRSFFETIGDLDDADQLQIYRAICEFSLNEKSIDLTGFSKTIFRLIEPQLLANKRRFKNGCLGAKHGIKGGRPKNKITPKKPQANPEITPNLTPNKNNNLNLNLNNNLNQESKSESQFEKFWNLYGKKLSRLDAEKKFKAALKKDTFENIIAGVERYVKTRGADSQYWKHPSTWLHNECWKDEHSTAKEETKSEFAKWKEGR